MIKKVDVLLLITIFLIGIGLTVAIFLPDKQAGSYVVIRQNGVELGSLPLSVDTTYPVKTKTGNFNLVTIKNGVASISEANCKDRLCTHGSGISKVGESIVCLPHKLSIEIVGESTNVPDAIVSQHSCTSLRRFL